MQNVRSISLLDKKYKGILHPDSLRWCHGTEGVEHDKVRKFRYPLYKYVQVKERRYIACICRNCPMVFFGEAAQGVPLEIYVFKHPTTYMKYELPVRVNGVVKYPPRVRMKNTKLGWATQEMIIEDTRLFIERVQ